MKKQVQKTTAAILALMMSIGLMVHAEEAWAKLDVVPNSINVTVDGIALTADNFLYQDTTYLPIRAVAEALGKDVSYDGATNTAIIADTENTPAAPSASAQSGSKGTGEWVKIDVSPNTIKVVVNGTPLAADNFLYQDTTYLPIRAVAEALARDVAYDSATNTAIIGGGTNQPEPSASAEPTDSPAPSADPTASASPVTSAPSTASASALPDVNLNAQTEPLTEKQLEALKYYPEWDWAPHYTYSAKEMPISTDKNKKKVEQTAPVGLTYHENNYTPQKIERYIGLLRQLGFELLPDYQTRDKVIFTKDDTHAIGLQKLENGNLRVICGYLSQFDALPVTTIDPKAEISVREIKETINESPNTEVYVDEAGQKYVAVDYVVNELTCEQQKEDMTYKWIFSREQRNWRYHAYQSRHINSSVTYIPGNSPSQSILNASSARDETSNYLLWQGQTYICPDLNNLHLMTLEDFQILLEFARNHSK